MSKLIVAAQSYELDEHGYLVERGCWNKKIAEALASKENITLTAEHWQVINFLREFYQAHELILPLRIFLKTLKEAHGSELGNSLKLHQLFPESPLKYACMIAGIPKPKHCM
jgi:tRNA 2-thiouridine synthesizing protein E